MRGLMDCLRDPVEGPLLMRVVSGNAGDEARLAYAAALEAGGDERGTLLRLACEAGQPSDPERDAAEVRAILSRTHEGWWNAVRPSSRPIPCGNAPGAGLVRFSFVCDVPWEAMQPTALPNVRQCAQCATPVTRCDTLAEAEALALRGACLTVPARILEGLGEYTRNVVGRPDQIYAWAQGRLRDLDGATPAGSRPEPRRPAGRR